MLADSFCRESVLRQVAQRFQRFGPLAPSEIAAVIELKGEFPSKPRGADVTAQMFEGPHVVLSGWACQMRPVEKRRRQIFGFFMPGDIIGSFWRNPNFSFFNTVALTRLQLLPAVALLAKRADGSREHPGLIFAARRAEDHSQHLLFDHMVRLEQRDAYRGLASLLLEMHARLTRVGLAANGAFKLPIGQRVLAQALGLSVAHTNHTLQRMVADGLFEARGDAIHLLKPDKMTVLAGLFENEGLYGQGAKSRSNENLAN